MKLLPQNEPPKSTLQCARDGVLLASATAMLAYLVHEMFAPTSHTRAFLENQKRLREVGEDVLTAVRELDSKLQTLIEKNEALAQTVAAQAKRTPARRKSASGASKAKAASKTKAAKAETTT